MAASATPSSPSSHDHRKLATYFHDEYEPKKLGHLSDGARRNWRKAVRSFLRFTSPAVTIGELNQQSLEEFDEWLHDRGIHLQTVAYYGGCVRKVLHAADQKRFKTRDMAPLSFVPENSRDEGTLWHFFESVYVPSRMGQVRESSFSHLRCVLRSLDRWACRSVRVDELSDELVMRFMQSFVGRRSPSTINTMRGAILTLWNLAWRRRLVKRRPRVEKLRVAKQAPECWTLGEMRRILQAAADEPGYVDGLPAGVWWFTLVHLLYFTGLRVGAVMRLRPEHLRLDEGVVRVPAELQKQNAEQVVQLHPRTIEGLRRLHDGRTAQVVFPWSKTKRMLYAGYARILQRAGLPHGRRDLFHKIRRTSATFLAADPSVGVAGASRHLGHSTLDVTRRYIDEAKLPVFDTAKLLPDPAAGVPMRDGAAKIDPPAKIRDALAGNALSVAELRNVVEWLRSTGMRVESIARMIGCLPGTLSQYLENRRPMPPRLVCGLRSIAGVEPPDAPPIELRASPLWRFFRQRFAVEKLADQALDAHRRCEQAIRGIEGFANRPLSPHDLTDGLIGDWERDRLTRGLSHSWNRKLAALLVAIRQHAQLPAVDERGAA